MANQEPLHSTNLFNIHWSEQVSVGFVCTRLTKRLIKKNRMAKRPKLTKHNCQILDQWAINHNFWNEGRWNWVLFTDESKFRLHVNDDRLMVWRIRGQC